MGWMPVSAHILHAIFDQFVQHVAHFSQMLLIFLHVTPGDFARFSQSHDLKRIFRTRPPVIFVISTVNQFFKLNAVANKQHTDAFVRIQFMAGD